MTQVKTQARVIIFTTPTCSWCNAVKRYLREKRIRFRDIDVSRSESVFVILMFPEMPPRPAIWPAGESEEFRWY